MAQIDDSLPEGTDQIIDGAAETRTPPATGDSAFAGFKSQLRDGTNSLRQQAGDRVREYAVDGKDRATTTLDDIAQAVTDAAASVDQRLGTEYGDYARRAADAVKGLSDSLRNKEVEDLYDDARELVRKSPAAAIGIAAAVGFALIRLVKAGTEDAPTRTASRSRKGGKTSNG